MTSSPFASAAPADLRPASPAVAAHAPSEKLKTTGSRQGPARWSALGAGGLLLVGMCGLVAQSTSAAGQRLVQGSLSEKQALGVAIADQAEVAYCTPAFKQVLTRVIHACGLDGDSGRRGCQPADVKTLASISDADFNALFTPLKDRGAVLLFDNGKDELDEEAATLLEERFADRRGARYFFVVARASKRGGVEMNRGLSHRRANSVKFYLEKAEPDADLAKEMGQLWLGSEFAQLDQGFCDWTTSRSATACTTEAINRSVFVSWVDCRL